MSLSPATVVAAALLVVILGLTTAVAQPAPLPGNLVTLSPGAVGRLGGGQYLFHRGGLMFSPVTVSADGRTIAYGVGLGSTVFRSLSDPAEVWVAEARGFATDRLAISPDGSTIYAIERGPTLIRVVVQ